MKRIVTALLAFLVFSPAIATAADKNATQERQASTAVTSLQKLDLNRASLEELVGVPGIGPRMARAIVDLRTKKGAFKRVDELLEVTGIKEKKLASIAGYLEVLPLQTPATSTPSALSR